MLNKREICKWIIGVIILFVPVLVYILKFVGFSISDDPSDWGVFGDYIGGIYTVLVTIFAIYLTRHLDKRDVERNKARTAYGEIYEQICKIDYQKVDLRSVKKLLKLANEKELYLPNDVYSKLTELYDDYVEAKDHPETFQLEKEVQIKSRLKRLYDS